MKYTNIIAAVAFGLIFAACGNNAQPTENTDSMNTKPVPGTDGDKYVPMDQRTGDTAVVYFTRDLSANGLIKAYEQVNGNINGKVAVKLHTGEQNGPNIIPREWVKALMQKDLKDGTIVETNTYYEGDRYTTENNIAKPSRSTAGPSHPSTSWTKRTPSPCLSWAANGSPA